MTARLTPLLHFLALLACRPSQTPSAASPTPEPTVEPPGSKPGILPGPTTSNRCPGPPKDALTFHSGSVVVQQRFVDSNDGSLKRGYVMHATGVSYQDGVACVDWHDYLNQDWRFPVKRGEMPGEYLFEVALTIPADDIKDILGEHDDGGAFLFNPRFAANQVYIGWHDGESYHWVDSLPQGWTDSKVCIESVSVDHLKATVLFDPLDGPYTRNEHNNLQQPIWFELEAWATYFDNYKYPHTCLATVWYPSSTKQLFFGD